MGPASKIIVQYPSTFFFLLCVPQSLFPLLFSLYPCVPPSLWLCLLSTPLHLGWSRGVDCSWPQSLMLYVFCVCLLWCNRKWLAAISLRQSATQRGRTCCYSGLLTGKLLHGLVAMARRPGSRGVTSVWNHAFQLHCLIVQDSRGPWDVSPQWSQMGNSLFSVQNSSW